MDDTAFDALCEGASPAEAKQLRKLLAAWCQGDENSFPVQLVLLNRSQFRAAAKVLLTIEAARASLQKEFREQQNCIASQIFSSTQGFGGGWKESYWESYCLVKCTCEQGSSAWSLNKKKGPSA